MPDLTRYTKYVGEQMMQDFAEGKIKLRRSKNMKFKVTFKDPDALYNCIDDAAKDSLAAIEGIADDEREILVEKRAEKMREFAGKFMAYGEYIHVEFDTEKETAVVVPEE